MAKIISDDAVLAEMEKSGADDFFQVQAVLQQKLNAAELAAEKLKPLAVENDGEEPWTILPSESAVLERMATYGITYQESFDQVKADLIADARRLNSCAPDSGSEISKALAQADVARERAAALVLEHETVLENITAQIFLLGRTRKKIAVAKSLSLSDAGAARIAQSAIGYFVERQVQGATTANVSAFRSTVEDLAFRKVLTNRSIFMRSWKRRPWK